MNEKVLVLVSQEKVFFVDADQEAGIQTRLHNETLQFLLQFDRRKLHAFQLL